MPKLNQIVAVSNGKKTQAQKKLGDIYQQLQKGNLFEGISRKYQPLDEDGDTFPPERKKVQMTHKESLLSAKEVFAELLDITATQDFANCEAKADVKVDGTVIVKGAPVSYLLFLEKKLIEMGNVVNTIPTLSPEEDWEWSKADNCYRSSQSKTNKTKKVPRTHVKYEATDHHPAQTELYYEDIKVGEWETIKFSGAIEATEKAKMTERVKKLQEAVKYAREQANNMDVEKVSVSATILDFAFGKEAE